MGKKGGKKKGGKPVVMSQQEFFSQVEQTSAPLRIVPESSEV